MNDQPITAGEHIDAGDPVHIDSEGKLRRSDLHPVPRIEIVETPTRRAVAATPSTARVPHPQPWHVRYIGGNGEPLATSEQLTSQDAADTNAVALVLAMVRAIHPVATASVSRRGDAVAVIIADEVGVLGIVPALYVREGDAS